MTSKDRKPPLLDRAYVSLFSKLQRQIDTSESGIQRTLSFGRKLIWIGVVVLTLCAVLPDDSRRLFVAAMGFSRC